MGLWSRVLGHRRIAQAEAEARRQETQAKAEMLAAVLPSVRKCLELADTLPIPHRMSDATLYILAMGAHFVGSAVIAFESPSEKLIARCRSLVGRLILVNETYRASDLAAPVTARIRFVSAALDALSSGGGVEIEKIVPPSAEEMARWTEAVNSSPRVEHDWESQRSKLQATLMKALREDGLEQLHVVEDQAAKNAGTGLKGVAGPLTPTDAIMCIEEICFETMCTAIDAALPPRALPYHPIAGSKSGDLHPNAGLPIREREASSLVDILVRVVGKWVERHLILSGRTALAERVRRRRFGYREDHSPAAWAGPSGLVCCACGRMESDLRSIPFVVVELVSASTVSRGDLQTTTTRFELLSSETAKTCNRCVRSGFLKMLNATAACSLAFAVVAAICAAWIKIEHLEGGFVWGIVGLLFLGACAGCIACLISLSHDVFFARRTIETFVAGQCAQDMFLLYSEAVITARWRAPVLALPRHEQVYLLSNEEWQFRSKKK